MPILRISTVHTGRPSVDPELLIRMLLVGYCFGIRSERRLCEEVHLNLAYRWFCRLDLSGRVPDHSTFSKNRHGRFRDSELLRHLFETTVARCIEEGLVSGQRMAVDASLIEADAKQAELDAEGGLGRLTRSIQPMRPARFVSISIRWMRPHSAPPAKCSPSSRRIPTRPASGPRLVKGRHSSAIPTTT